MSFTAWARSGHAGSLASARLAGPDRLRVEAKLPAWPERAQAVKDILLQLAA